MTTIQLTADAISSLPLPTPAQLGRVAYFRAYHGRRHLLKALRKADELGARYDDLSVSDYTQFDCLRKSVRSRISAINTAARNARKVVARRARKGATQ